jgi:predicted TIM-barrel fold metal-dependent hydrolase
MIVDAHHHLDEHLQPTETLVAEMDRCGVDVACLIASPVASLRLSPAARVLGSLMTRSMASPFPRPGLFFYRRTVTRRGTCSILGKEYPLCAAPDNAPIALALETYPRRFYGWVFVNPRACDPLTELDRWKDRPGWIGVKAHPFWHRYPVRELDEVARWCRDRGWPLLLHLGADPDTGDYRYLPDRHPDLRVVYAHAAVPFYREAWRSLAGKDSVLIDLSSVIYVDDAVLSQAVRTMGPSRCLWGTDGPYGRIDYRAQIERICRLPLSDQDKDHILGENLLGLIRTRGAE